MTAVDSIFVCHWPGGLFWQIVSQFLDRRVLRKTEWGWRWIGYGPNRVFWAAFQMPQDFQTNFKKQTIKSYDRGYFQEIGFKTINSLKVKVFLSNCDIEGRLARCCQTEGRCQWAINYWRRMICNSLKPSIFDLKVTFVWSFLCWLIDHRQREREMYQQKQNPTRGPSPQLNPNQSIE